MKKSILSICATSLLSGMPFAQSVVQAIPANTQGYIVLKENGISIDCWQVSFTERKWNSTSDYVLVPLESVRVCGKDYLALPDAFGGDSDRDILFSVVGYDANGGKHAYDTDVSTGTYQGMNGEAGSLRRCGAICDGQRQGYAYAYETYVMEYFTSQNPNGTGAGSVNVDIATKYQQDAVNVPYYAYVPTSNIQNHFWLNYQYTPAQYQNEADQNPLLMSPVLNTIDLGPGVGIMDPSNQWVSGYYRMIAKNLGPWRLHAASMQYPGLSVSQVCNYDINFFINTVNSNPNYSGPDLECYGNGFALQNAQTSQFDGDCLPIQSGNMMATLDGFNSALDVLDAIEDCIDPSTGPGHWWEELGYASLEHIFSPELGSGGDGTTSPEVFGYSYSRGVFANTGVLTEGLYRLNAVTRSGEYFPLIVEVKEKQTFTFAQKDMMDVNFFPVPIVDNTYTMDLSIGFSGKLLYQLIDDKGNVIYEETLDVKKTATGETHRVKVQSDIEIPSGLLFNRFVCPDGSVYAETIMK